MIFAILIGLVIVFGYFLNQYSLNYWSRNGFKQLDPKFFFGDAASLLTLRTSIGEYYAELYNKYKKLRIFGIYFSYKPILVVTDPKIVRDILIRDFNNFHDRPTPVDEANDPLSGHLFNLHGQKWRDLRVKLSPTFTSGKLKGMFSIIKDCSQFLEDYLIKNVKNGVDVFEFRDLMARYNTNIISSVAFGIDNDCINEPDHPFRIMGAKIFEASFTNGAKSILSFMTPKLFHKLKLKIVDQEVEDFIFAIVKQNVKYREEKNFSRNDFMQLLIQLKNQGYVTADKSDKKEGETKTVSGNNSNTNKMDMNTLAAQVFVFFAAGEILLITIFTSFSMFL